MCSHGGPVNDQSSNPADGARTRREDFAEAAKSIEQDFRRLVDNLTRTIELAADDEELSLRLSRTKSVAERGARLSRLLTRLTRSKKR